MNTNEQNNASGTATDRLVDSVDQMVRWPFQMTSATWDLMMQGMQAVTGSTGKRTDTPSSRTTDGSTRDSWRSMFTNQQDLSGTDLKYVIWSIVFTKPGFECVLEPQHEEMINYSADGASFAALKIAKFLENARHGRTERPAGWRETSYAVSSSGDSTASEGSTEQNAGWRIPAEDQKYIKFLYRVDWRIPKEEDVVERVTIERNVGRVG
jgi:hypothetical protein